MDCLDNTEMKQGSLKILLILEEMRRCVFMNSEHWSSLSRHLASESKAKQSAPTPPNTLPLDGNICFLSSVSSLTVVCVQQFNPTKLFI
jgi:hypothetical protein